MKLEELLTTLETLSISIGLVDGKLKLLDPENNLTSDLLSLIRTFKPELIDVLDKGKRLSVHDFPLAKLTPEAFQEVQQKYPRLSNIYPATSLQKGLLFHGLLDGNGRSYTSQTTCLLEGNLDITSFWEAWQKLIQDYDVLRTCFVGLDSDVIHQLVDNSVSVPCFYHDLTDNTKDEQTARLRELIEEDKSRGFEFGEAPLMRVTLIKLSPSGYQVIWSNHHVLLDGWSKPILFQQVIQDYRNLTEGNRPPPRIIPEYKKYIEWLQRVDTHATVDFWREQLNGFSYLGKLPFESANEQSEVENCIRKVVVEEAVSLKLKKLAESESCTLFCVFQLAWAYLLRRYSGESKVIFGTTVSGRPSDIPDVDKMVGMFINTLPVALDVEQQASIGDLLQKLKQDNISRDKFSFSSLVEIQKALDSGASTGPLFDTALTFQNYPVEKLMESASAARTELKVRAVDTEMWTDFALDMGIYNSAELEIWCRFNEKRISSDTVDRILCHFSQVLSEMAEGGSHLKLNDIRMLPEEERLMVQSQWNDVAGEMAIEGSFHEHFMAQVQRTPGHLAVSHLDQGLSYQELDALSDKWAGYLQSIETGPGKRVGLLMSRGMPLAVGLLSVLKSGASFVLIDPDYPVSRQMYMLSDSGAQVLLTESRYSERAAELSEQVIELSLSDAPEASLEPVSIGAASESCVFYTSGSTGQPKGSVYSHGNLINYAYGMSSRMKCHAGDRVLQLASVSFDVVLEELLPAWLSGATVVVRAGEGLDISELDSELRSERINYVELSYSQWREWLYWLSLSSLRPAESLKSVLVGCDAIPGELMAKWSSYGIRLLHVYGLTEATVTTTVWDSDEWQGERHGMMPMGRPLLNTQCYVLNESGQLQPVGVGGELYIGGAGVTSGYLNRPELTASRFVPNPFGPGVLYRTGDQVRWRADGQLVFMGRQDSQVKIRGYRIELGEVESQLASLPGVRESVVVVQEQGTGDKRLVGYVVPQGAVSEDESWLSDIRAELQTRLPGYMVPGLLMPISGLPLTANGKVDVKALPSPVLSYEDTTRYEAPQSETEQVLCDIWQQALGVERVGVTDNFFEIGGDSIISIQVASRAVQSGLQLSVKQLFEHQTIRALAGHLQTVTISEEQQRPVTGEQTLLPIHHWLFSHKQGVDHNNMSVLLDVPVDLPKAFLQDWLQAIYHRHDALRLRFVHDESTGSWSASYGDISQDKALSGVLVCVDAPDDEAAFRECLAEQGQRLQESLTLHTGQLMRVGYFNSGVQARLLLIVHHSIMDGVSWRILLDDLSLAYQQYQSGEPVKLAPKGTSYQRWGEELVAFSRSQEFATSRAYWEAQAAKVVPLLPVDEGVQTAEAGNRAVKVKLDETQTQLLLQRCQASYKSQINELLLSALWQGLHGWTGQQCIRVWMEGHGREELLSALDLGQTLGWFTTLYPLTLDIEHSQPEQVLREVKRQYRLLPDKGLSYGMTRYMQPAGQSVSDSSIDIMFNYLGRLDGSLNEQTKGFSLAREFAGHNSHQSNGRESRLGFDGMVLDGCLQFTLHYGAQDYHEETMQTLAQSIEQALEALVSRVEEREAIVGALSGTDFPLSHITDQQVQQWYAQYGQVKDLYPAVPMQEGMVFHRLLDDQGDAYLAQMSYEIRGELHVSHLRDAWEYVVARHDALRTCFVGLEGSEIQQLVLESVSLPWRELDISDMSAQAQEQYIQTYAEEEQFAGFDIATAPLFKLTLFRLGDRHYRLQWGYFMGLFDGWSLPLISHDLFSCYRALEHGHQPSDTSPVSYKAYVRWLSRRDVSSSCAYWRDYLSGFTAATPLPVGQGAPSASAGQMAVGSIALSQTDSEALAALVKANRTTMNVLVQAAWGYLLHRYSGEPDVVFGTTVSGRPSELRDVEQMVGLFINTVPVRIQVTPGLTLSSLMEQIHAANVARDEHSYLPLKTIQQESDIESGAPLFDSYLVFQNYPIKEITAEQTNDLDELELSVINSDAKSDYAFDISVHHREKLEVTFEYNDAQYSKSDIDRILYHFSQVLSEMAEGGSHLKLNDIRMLPEEERLMVQSQWNDVAGEMAIEGSFHEHFMAQVQRTPGHLAVSHLDQGLSYQELDALSDKWAGYLQSIETGPGKRVGLLMSRGMPLAVGLLSVLKSGASFVLIDPDYPVSRQMYMLSDSGAQVLLTESRYSERAAELSEQVIELSLSDAPEASLEPVSIGAASESCVFYTSGSTGQPKGSVYSHGNLINYAYGMSSRMKCHAGDRVLQLASVSFDVVLEELLPAWLSGATVVVRAGEGLDISELDSELRSERINYVELSYSQWREWLYWLSLSSLRPAESLKSVLVGCDAIPGELMAKWSSYGIRLLHVYGLTEATVTTTVWDSDEWQGERHGMMPMGRPLLNTQCYVLNESGQLQPVGVGGELYIGGAGVTSGYLNRPELTASRFVPNPFGPGVLYRTGDQVRWRADGQLVFMGRQDSQVKIRGYRIELGEVESQLASLPGVRESVVVVQEQGTGDKRLVGYVVPQGAVSEDESWLSDIRAELQTRLPGYMVPGLLMPISGLPLTANGKVDVKALPSPVLSYEDTTRYEAPQSETEQVLCDIWQQALGVERVGVTDNFFEIGGDSIISIQVASRAVQSGLQLSVKQLFEHQTIRALAGHLQTVTISEEQQRPVTGEQTLLPIHHWLFSHKQGVDHNNMSVLLDVPVDLPKAFLQDWLQAIYHRHDALRLRFVHDESTGSWSASYGDISQDKALSGVLVCVDAPDDEAAFRECLAEQGQRLQESLTLHTGQLMRVGYFNSGVQARLLLIVHHSIMDGVSWRILLDDLSLAYQQYQSGEPVKLAPKGTSYQRWGEELVAFSRSQEFATSRAYWEAQAAKVVPLLPVDEGVQTAEAGNRAVKVKLDETQTQLLLQRCQASYKSQINELLLSALWQGLHGWTGQQCIRVWMEGHGREELLSALDLGQTLGWFTTLYPLTLDIEHSQPEQVLREVKRQYRLLPDKGLSYGMTRYMQPAGQSVSDSSIDIMFNYLGRLDGSLNEQTKGFSLAREFAGHNSHQSNGRESRLGFDGMVLDGCLQFTLHYGAQDYHEETMQTLAQSIEQALEALVSRVEEREAIVGALSGTDFPLSHITDQQVQQWYAQYGQVKDLYPAVPMQEGMVFHRLLDDQGDAYLAQMSYEIRGELHVSHLRDAWEYVVARHDALRTCFVGLEGSEIQQLVLESVSLPWRELDISDMSAQAQEQYIQTYAEEEQFAGFDIATAPLFKLTLFRLGDRHYRLQWGYFMGLFDGWSLPLISHDLFSCYRALEHGHQPSDTSPVSYKAYVRWLSRRDVSSSCAYWRDYLSGFTAATPLPVGQGAPSASAGQMAVGSIALSQTDSEALAALVKANRTTMNVLVQAAWGYLLHRYSGEPDVVFGTTVSGRPSELRDVEQMVGLFINTVPVRIQVTPGLTLSSLMEQIHAANVARDEHSYLPLKTIQQESDIESGAPLFDSYLVFQNYPDTGHRDGKDESALKFTPKTSLEKTNYKLYLVSEYKDKLHLSFKFDQSQYSANDIDLLLNQLKTILNQFVKEPHSVMQDIEVLSKEDISRLSEWNDTAYPFPEESSIVSLFEEQVALNSDTEAVRFRGQGLSYRELDEKSGQLASYLMSQGVGPGSLVGVCMERSLSLMVAMMGILKAGGAYVALDPGYPADRLAYMLEDSGCEYVLSQTGVSDVLPTGEHRVLALDDTFSQAAFSGGLSSPLPPVPSESLCYVIYTSGSTGAPKGVCVEHRALVNRLHWMQRRYGLSVSERVLQKTPYSFDVSVWELFWPLISGATVVFSEPEGHKDDAYLTRVIQEEKISTLHFVPTMLRMILQSPGWSDCQSLRQVFCSGEALSMDLVKRFESSAVAARLYNLYGPTEAAIDVTYWDGGSSHASGEVPIGRAIDNIQLYVLDSQMRRMPPGSVGELYLGGAGLARGYLNKPELTAERFVANPYGEGRLYRTGDLVRWLPDGELAYTGRNDHQIKLRGFRIELGEIESHLQSVAGVNDAVVQVHDAGAQPRLVAYVVSEEPEAALSEKLSGHLRSSLPEYMVPGQYVVLSALPQLPNGKVDRKQLVPPSLSEETTYRAPQTETERQLCEVWSEVLKVERVGTEDNFFGLGGDSILSIQVVSRCRQLGLRVSVRQLFEHQTVRRLSQVVSALDAGTEAEQGEVTGEQVLLPVQRQFFEQTLSQPNHYNQSVLLKTPPGFTVEALQAIVQGWYARHDSLHVRFVPEGQSFRGVYTRLGEEQVRTGIQYYDMRAVPLSARASRQLALCEAAQASLDISQGELFRAVYFEYEEEGRLLLVLHHLIVDGISWRILLPELELAWQQLSSGAPVVFAQKSSSYQQFGQALQAYSQSEALHQELAYWVSQAPQPVVLPSGDAGSGRAQVSLDEEQTRALLGRCNEAYRTQINELLLSALLRGYQRWSGESGLSLHMEGHGREELFSELDISETLGWFTSMYPLRLTASPEDDTGTLIQEVKEQCRAIPNNGIGYGVLRYLSQAEGLQAQGVGEVEFNYLGQFDNTLDASSAFALSDEPMGASVSGENVSPVRLSVNGFVTGAKLQFSLTSQDLNVSIDALAKEFHSSLINLIEDCFMVLDTRQIMEEYEEGFNDDCDSDEDILI